MFDPRTGAEVVIRPFDEKKVPYVEYLAPPGSQHDSQGANERWIEAVTDERFKVEVNLHPVFPFHGEKEVHIDLKIDGGSVWVTSRIANAGSMRKTALTESFESNTVHLGGKGYHCGYVFGQLQLVDDTAFLSADEEENEVARRGKIVLTLRRGHTEKSKKSSGTDQPTQDGLPEDVFFAVETTKKVARENGRSHSVKPTKLYPVPGGKSYAKPFKYAECHGEEITFTFYYTSRDHLELCKIVPMITYPGTKDEAILIEDHEASPPPPQQPLNVAKVEAEPNVKPEPGVKTEAGIIEVPTVKPERKVVVIESDDEAETSQGPRRKIKRERAVGADDRAAKRARLQRQLKILEVKQELEDLDDGE